MIDESAGLREMVEPAFPIAIDVNVEAGGWPAENALDAIARSAAAAVCAELQLTASNAPELSILFTDDAHIQLLNARWRGRDKPTNVLSFPAFPAALGELLPPLLGDIVLAEQTIRREAMLEEKPFDHHLSHLIVHGFLHLLGYDHETVGEAEEMEAVERRVLARLAIPDPYALTESGN